jgi:hypothetical protein
MKRASGAPPGGAMPKVKAATAAEACQSAALGDEARALLTPQANVVDFLTLLTDHELFSDAVTLMAHALPKREAVWWACLAARTLIDEQTLPEVVAALEGAEAWVFKPSDETRRAAMERAHKTQFDHPAVWAAVGAFWSGGSMVAPELPEVPPAEHLTGLAVSGAVRLAAVSRNPESAPEKYRALLAQALDIANGGNGQVNKAS